MNKIEYTSGIQGYSPKGKIGETGKIGFSLYFAPYDLSNDDDIIIIKEKIINGESLTNNKNDKTYSYQTNDVIIDKFARMYTVKINLSEEDLKKQIVLVYAGNVINQTKNENIETPLTIEDIKLKIISHNKNRTLDYQYYNGTTAYPYNRCKNNETVYELDFTNESKETLKNLFKEGNIYKVVALHRCGLSQEWLIDQNSINSIYISKKYLQMTKSEELNNTNCDFYLEVNIKDRGTYRKKITLE